MEPAPRAAAVSPLRPVGTATAPVHGPGHAPGAAGATRAALCPLALAALVTTVQRRVARRAAQKPKFDGYNFQQMADYLRQSCNVDIIKKEGRWINGLVCPCCKGGDSNEISFSVLYEKNKLVCKCWRSIKCGRVQVFPEFSRRSFWRTPAAAPVAAPAAAPVAAPAAAPVALGEKLVPLMKEHMEWFKNRGISEETLTRNRVCSKWLKNKRSAIVFPFYEGEKIVAEKFRALPKLFFQTKGGKKTLYGLDDVKGQKEVVLTEGEIDKLSMDEAGVRWSASIQAGVNSTDFSPDVLEMLRSAQRVVLALDGDAAGQECVEKVAEELYWNRCYVVQWPEGCKDANEVLLKHGPEELRKLVKEAKLLKCPWETRLDTKETMKLVKQRVNGTMPRERIYGVSTGWKSLDQLWRPVPGEITVVTGTPGHGKSEFLLSLAVNLANLHSYRTLIFAFESTFRNLSQQLCLKARGSCAHLAAADETQILSWVDDRIFVESEFKADEDVSLDGILKKAAEEVKEGQLNMLMIDPYNFLERSKDEVRDLEHHYIGKLLQRLRKFAEDNGVHVIIVAHPTKATSWDGEKPTLYNIAGSSNWFNKVDNGLVISRREFVEDGHTIPTDQVDISAEKVRNRDAGQLGKTTFVFARESRCFNDSVAPPPEADPNLESRAAVTLEPRRQRQMALVAATEDEQNGEY